MCLKLPAVRLAMSISQCSTYCTLIKLKYAYSILVEEFDDMYNVGYVLSKADEYSQRNLPYDVKVKVANNRTAEQMSLNVTLSKRFCCKSQGCGLGLNACLLYTSDAADE